MLARPFYFLGECMNIKRKLSYLFLSLMLVLTSCTNTNQKEVPEVDDKTIDQAADEILKDNGLINDAIDKPIGKP